MRSKSLMGKLFKIWVNVQCSRQANSLLCVCCTTSGLLSFTAWVVKLSFNINDWVNMTDDRSILGRVIVMKALPLKQCSGSFVFICSRSLYEQPGTFFFFFLEIFLLSWIKWHLIWLKPEGAILLHEASLLKALNNINCVAERIINCHKAVSLWVGRSKQRHSKTRLGLEFKEQSRIVSRKSKQSCRDVQRVIKTLNFMLSWRNHFFIESIFPVT